MENSDNDKYVKLLSAEIQLNHRHDEILAKRELLLASRENLEKSKEKSRKTTKGDLLKAKAMNDQIVQEIEATHRSLRKRATNSTDPTFVAMRNNYMTMMEKEATPWLARTHSQPSPK